MRFGIGIPTCREGVFYPVPFASAKDIAEVTQLAERLGFDSVCGTDWITPTPFRKIPDKDPPNWYELLISLAYCAALTNRITLVAATIVLPFRDPIILAKQVSTLDHFSEGRFVLGIGLGGNREEFEFLRPRDAKAHRGHMLEEQLEAINLLLSGEKVSFHGRYVEFDSVALNPKPFQRSLPIYISGYNAQTSDRIAKWGKGQFIPIAPGRIRERTEALRKALAKVGRDISEIDILGHTYMSVAKSREEAVKRFEQSRVGARYRNKSRDVVLGENFIGTPSEIAEQMKSLQKEGMTHCVAANFAVNSFEDMKEQVHQFAEEVIPHFKTL